MFTGIVQAVGRIVRPNPLEIDAGPLDLSRVALGDSICVQGVCLTVSAMRGRGFTADVSAETLRVTTGLDRPGAVNLEKSLALGDKLGGHLVTGHVDGVGEVTSRNGSVFRFRLPGAITRYVAIKGSICVDGVSLTVNQLVRDEFEVNLIPHTLKVTTLARLEPGSKVNLEVDLVARYVARLLEASNHVPTNGG
ncbi:MAG TPA: riboflavin synthase [Steroidobacteraceae bacterium]|nr:riboflavin synthase [Steroidobacteraceae bacterium]